MTEFEEINRRLRYDPETGALIWKVRARAQNPEGSKAGSMGAGGYLNVKVAGRSYRAHRVAWLLHYGRWPADQIDHVNGQRTDNRLANLRECSNAHNSQNLGMRPSNISGFTGVCWHKRAAKWHAQIMVAGNKRYLGLFDTAEEAYHAYLQAKVKLHTFNPTPRESAR